jgi:uncharacterized OB-fold protein
MDTETRKQIPVATDLFSMPGSPEGARLLANKCPKCGEIYFPKETLCLRCGNLELQDAALSKDGVLYTFTVIRQQPPIYKGPVPYAIGVIELPEKIRATCLLTQCDFTTLKIGMKMELVIERLHDDDQGNEVVCYKFKPVA